MESLFDMLPTFAGMGKIGLIAFAICVAGYGIWKLAASWQSYNNQVQDAIDAAAESAASADEALDNTDQIGDDFLDS